jgi:hypothetical protein
MITTDVLQYFLNIGTSTTAEFAQVTEDTAFNPSVNREEYSPKYKCNKVQPKYSAGKTTAIDVDIDVEDKPLQGWFLDHEDDDNVATDIVRVRTDKGTAPSHPAKKAAFVWNGNPLDGEASGPLKVTGKLDMTSDGWTEGTFNTSTKTFTAS